MPKSTKYKAIVEATDSTWRAQIVRQVSSRKVIVSKSQEGFNSEQEAQAWAEAELKQFIKIQEQSNKRHSAKRQSQASIKAESSKTDKS